jgi:L-threonylcarbamoyladenylate synthase
MRTLHLVAANPADILRAAELLREGHLVAFATETVYGLGANALDPAAIARIFAAKQRPAWDPLIVHLADATHLPLVTSIAPPLASRLSHLASLFWPGPLTLLLPRNASVPDAVTAGRELVGVRVPAHPAAQALLAAANLPIAAPSANRFGHTSPTTAQHVLADLDGRIDAVLDAGPTSIGLESTVLDPTQTPMVLYRPGGITAAQLVTATGIPVTTYIPPANRPLPTALPSPGVGIRHYAPRATLVLTGPTPESLWERAADRLMSFPGASTVIPKLGVLLPAGWPPPPNAILFDWGPFDDPATLAAHLFNGLRTLDAHHVDLILCPLPPSGGLRDAIRDRLQKAARPS